MPRVILTSLTAILRLAIISLPAVVVIAAATLVFGRQTDYCFKLNVDCTVDVHLLTVSQASTGFWQRILCIAALALVYVVSRRVPGIARWYAATRSGIAHTGWTIAAFQWLAFGALESTLGICTTTPCMNVLTELLRFVAPLLLAVGCFLHGLRRPNSKDNVQWFRRVEAVLAMGFLALATTLLLTSQVADENVRQIQLAFSDLEQRSLLDQGVLGGYWVKPSSEGGSLGSLLDAAPWLLFGLAYTIALTTTGHLAGFFRDCPIYPSPARAVGRWLLTRWDPIHAWTPTLAAIWLFVTGGLAIALLAQANPATLRPAGRALSLLPVYLALALPAVGWSVSLARAVLAPGDAKLCGPDETCRRNALIKRTSAARWVFLFVAGLVAGNVYLSVQASSASLVDAEPTSSTAPGLLVALLGPQVLGFAAVAFVCIGAHYFVLLEWPYSRGQQRWKAAEEKRATIELAAARSGLVTELTGAQSGATDRPSPATLAWFILAIEQRRESAQIPLHTFKGLADLVRKLGEWAGTAGAGALVGHQSAGEIAKGGLDVVVKWLISVFFTRGVG